MSGARSGSTATVTTVTTAPIAQSADGVDAWLAASTRPEPAVPLQWSGSSPSTSVRSSGHLSVLLSSLADGRFGVVSWAAGGAPMWGQTMRCGDRWIVELHEGSHHDFAQRVFRGEVGDYPQRTDDDELLEAEALAPYVAAGVLWSWQHGALPDGFHRTLRHLSPRERRRYGLPA